MSDRLRGLVRGGWLQIEDMGTDTVANGCAECRRRKDEEARWPPFIGGPGDEDIPF